MDTRFPLQDEERLFILAGLLNARSGYRLYSEIQSGSMSLNRVLQGSVLFVFCRWFFPE
jgi:hypothetical protein